MAATLSTQRLILRHWQPTDWPEFAAMNADPDVMAYFPGTLDLQTSHTTANHIAAFLKQNPFGLWAVEIPTVTDFAGFIGLAKPSWQAHFTPCIEIGWRLAHPYWHCGYATEGAKEVLRYGFINLRLPEIVSFTAKTNTRSIRVMERLGMLTHAKEDFVHPKLPKDSNLQPHVLYRLSQEHYLAYTR